MTEFEETQERAKALYAALLPGEGDERMNQTQTERQQSIVARAEKVRRDLTWQLETGIDASPSTTALAVATLVDEVVGVMYSPEVRDTRFSASLAWRTAREGIAVALHNTEIALDHDNEDLSARYQQGACEQALIAIDALGL